MYSSTYNICTQLDANCLVHELFICCVENSQMQMTSACFLVWSNLIIWNLWDLWAEFSKDESSVSVETKYCENCNSFPNIVRGKKVSSDINASWKVKLAQISMSNCNVWYLRTWVRLGAVWFSSHIMSSTRLLLWQWWLSPIISTYNDIRWASARAHSRCALITK